ncbi:hypothetical protein [Limnochorda pilosa]|uniref:hypothetical protein n=1 Tax=Limnochorda pilosa TaxID=1555112 RepID=UPI001EC1ECDE|nr:hypothetical protein [Limnochorda pilosa]MBO2518300.1 hypothetical protein [Bacillota bacterium]
MFQRPLILPRRLTFVPWSVTVPFLFLLGCLAGSPWPGAAASWEGQAAWEGEWDGPGPPLHRLLWEAAGPLAPPGWGAAARLVVERPGPAEEDRLAEGRLALTAPALQLQLLYDQAHLASGDPLALISGGRRNPQQPALTLEVASRHWDLTLQGVRQIDNPGPDGDLAAARLQGWWSGGRTALTLFRLETGLLGGVQPPNPANRGLLQELASVEGYVEVGPVEVGLQLVHTRTAGWEQRPLGPVQARGARLVRLRSLPWRPSERLRLEGGLFQTDGGFRSLAAREQRLPPDAAGFWTDLRLRSGPWRWENRFLHARLGGGGHHWEGELRSRLTWGGLTWSAGLEGKRVASGAGLEATQQLELGVGRSGRWEVTWRGGPETARLVVWSRLGRTGVEGRIGWDRVYGGTLRLELRRRETPWWRVVWKARVEREPDRALFVEAGADLAQGWFASLAVGRWDRGRYDALWGWPERLTLTIGRRF